MGLDKAKKGKRECQGERGSPEQSGGRREWRGVLAWLGGTSLSHLLGNPGVKITSPK